METVSVQILSSLFVEIYARHGEETSNTINDCLNRLLEENKFDLNPKNDSPHFMRPGEGTITGRVWEIADQLFEKTGEADRVAVVKACDEEDINMNTASTQFSHWKNAMIKS